MDRTGFSLPGYDGISFNAPFNLSLTVDFGGLSGAVPCIPSLLSPSSSTLSKRTVLEEGMIEATSYRTKLKNFYKLRRERNNMPLLRK